MHSQGWSRVWFVIDFSNEVQNKTNKQTNRHTQHNKQGKTRQTNNRQQIRRGDTGRPWASRPPGSARIAQPTPRNPCRGGLGLTAQRQPDHTDPADWSTQNPARKRRTNKTTTDGRRTDRRTNKPQRKHLGAARACNSRSSVARGG